MSHKLLLADDSITIQRVIELTFADEDVNVAAVGDGQQAIDRIEADPPDIILADVGMPKRDGYDVAAYVKSRPTLAHIPVVLLTGAFEPVDQARATAVGCDGVLAKPFEPHMVISRVKQLLKGASGSASARPGPAAAAPSQAAAPTAIAPDVRVQEPPTAVETVSAVTHEPAAKPKAADPQVSLDDYFDQLDAAFSNLDASQRGGSLPDRSAPSQSATQSSELDWAQKHAPSVPEGEKPSGLARTPGAGPNEFEWIATHAADVAGIANLDFSGLTDVAANPVEAAVPPRPVPVTETVLPPVSVVERVAPEVVSQPTPVAPVPSPHPRVAPFDESSRTAVEPPRPVVSVPMADAFVALLAAEQGETLTIPGVFAPPPAGASVGITDELVERVAERVLSRLNDSVVRETVRDTVSRVAERLVRDEIERIKRIGQ
jgi:CheY-like chemotaxis protein